MALTRPCRRVFPGRSCRTLLQSCGSSPGPRTARRERRTLWQSVSARCWKAARLSEGIRGCGPLRRGTLCSSCALPAPGRRHFSRLWKNRESPAARTREWISWQALRSPPCKASCRRCPTPGRISRCLAAWRARCLASRQRTWGKSGRAPGRSGSLMPCWKATAPRSGPFWDCWTGCAALPAWGH